MTYHLIEKSLLLITPGLFIPQLEERYAAIHYRPRNEAVRSVLGCADCQSVPICFPLKVWLLENPLAESRRRFSAKGSLFFEEIPLRHAADSLEETFAIRTNWYTFANINWGVPIFLSTNRLFICISVYFVIARNFHRPSSSTTDFTTPDSLPHLRIFL